MYANVRANLDSELGSLLNVPLKDNYMKICPPPRKKSQTRDLMFKVVLNPLSVEMGDKDNAIFLDTGIMRLKLGRSGGLDSLVEI